MFISFEGIDGSGKTTQAKMLYEHLKVNKRCVLTREPTKGPIGNFVKKMIMKKKINAMAAQLLFTADRSFHVENLIKPKLKQGYTVITDRYFFSTIAYGKASGMDEEWLTSINAEFMKPDITFVFDIDPELAIHRITKRARGTAYFEKLKFLETTREMYLRLAKKYACKVIDASKDINTISEEILKAAK